MDYGSLVDVVMVSYYTIVTERKRGNEMIEGYEKNLYLRDNKARITDLDFSDNYIHAKIKSFDYELEFSYKTNIGNVMEYIELDLQQLNDEIVDMAKRYFLSKTKSKG